MKHIREIQQLKNGIWLGTGEVMGGGWQIRFVLPTHQNIQTIVHTAFEALSRVDNLMSPYRDDNDIAHLGQSSLNEWVSVAPETATVIAKAQDIAKQTQQALDITLGNAIHTWGFGGTALIPTEIPTKRTYDVQLDPPAVRRHSHFYFNVCALAKGYAIDLAVQKIQNLGIEHFLIEASGEIYAQGQRPDGTPWQIGLELPLPKQTLVYNQITLDKQAIASSGSYRKFRIINGKTYAHTIDPHTAEPLQSDLLSVSVSAKDCMTADALATALFVMGLEHGSQYAHDHQISALFLSRAEEGIYELSSEKWLQQFNPKAIIND